VNAVEQRAAGGDVEVVQVRLAEQLRRLPMKAVVEARRFQEQAQLIDRLERFGHQRNAVLGRTVIAGRAADRLRHRRPRLDEGGIEPRLAPVPVERVADEGAVEAEKLPSVARRRAGAVDPVPGTVPVAVARQQLRGKIGKSGHR